MLLRPSTSITRQVTRLASQQTLRFYSKNPHTNTRTTRPFTTTHTFNMPDSLKSSEVSSKTDPSVAKQFDEETPMHKQFEDFYGVVDKLKVGLLTTLRKDVGPVSRSMATGKRVGPDFLYLANNHSQKFNDLENSKNVQITFQDSSTQNWVSITGEATTVSNSDPRIKEIHSKATQAWFGDLGDGVHDGGPEDPRMTLIEVKSKYIVYWMSEVTMLGFAKEVIGAAITGKVANTGVQRHMLEQDIEKARQMA